MLARTVVKYGNVTVKDFQKYEKLEYKKTISIRSVFEEDGKLYPQVFLDDTLYELNI